METGYYGPAARAITFFDIVNALLRHWRWVVGIPLLLAGGTVLLALSKPRVYTTAASFVPQGGEEGGAGLAGVAAQFGLRVPTARRTLSAEFYVDLLRSPAILREVAKASYEVPRGGRRVRVPLVDILEAPPGTPAQRLEATVRALRAQTSVSSARETGIVRLTVTTRWPELSAQIGTHMLDLVERFNLERRRTQAGAERRFTGERLAEARAELAEAENALQYFEARNRVWSNSPQLSMEHGRLERLIGMRQQVYTALAQSYEQARIDEVRNTPAITVIEPATPPPYPDGRQLASKGMVALILGLLLGVAAAAAAELIRHAVRRDERGRDEFRALRGRGTNALLRIVTLGAAGRRRITS